MSGEHLVGLECGCVGAASADHQAGGEVVANMTLNANLTSSILNESSITSPPQDIFYFDEVYAVAGNGPLYNVTLNECDDDRLDETWAAEIVDSENTYHYSITNIDGCSVTLLYQSSTDDIDRQIQVGDTIKFSGESEETLPRIVRARDMSVTLDFLSSVESRFNIIFPIDSNFEVESEIPDALTVDYSIGQDLVVSSELEVVDLDKIWGDFGDFYCQGKLYPSADLPIESGFGAFVGPFGETDNLYSYIDEGVYEGVMKDRGNSVYLSDDATSFIHPDTIHTEGLFQYKCELTNLNVRPDQTALRMRVAAPLQTYESSIAPFYTVYNIRLLDPSGNLIVKYGDIHVRGDSPVGISKYTTYSSLPETNRVDEYDWERRQLPFLQEGSGYQLSLSIRAVDLSDPFNPGFDKGFEENYCLPDIVSDSSGNNYLALDGAPLSSQEVKFLNPTDGFKISSIEICNSGGLGPRREDYLSVYMEVPEIGRRLERCIHANFMPTYDYDTSVYPSVRTVWSDDVGGGGSPLGVTNETLCGAEKLVGILNAPNSTRYIKVQAASGGGIADSGKLVLRFGQSPVDVDEITQGSFSFEFDQTSNRRWWSPSGAFNTENRRENVHLNDSIFYTVESVSLKVLAKKQAGTRDYVLDVVGYSEDKLLNNTLPSGGFLQNPSVTYLNDFAVSSVGSHPVISGFYNYNDDALDGGSLSERGGYWEASGNSGGDHYSLAQYPVVTGVDFQWYEVPLEILDDDVLLGLSRNYSQSSLLEKIYLDIYPLPSGASVAYAGLCVRYKPTNALNFYTQGGERFGKVQDGRSESALFPSAMASGDDILNAGSGYHPLSYISGVPQLYGTNDSIKTNYSRRWRGVEGTVRGPYDPDAFGFGFENPTIDYPFLSGYYRFDNVDGLYVQSTNLGPAEPSGLGTLSGVFTTTPSIYHNIGWRLSTGTLFPGIDKGYTTTDFAGVGDPLYGKIADAFDRVARISQDAQNVNFGNVETSGGFSVFVRFTPDVDVSGASYDLFQSGVIFSKWDSPANLDFALAYSGGYLCGYAKDDGGNIISVADTVSFSGYQYPLNVILTYNDNESSGLKLYTDNEFVSPWSVLRASSAPFRKGNTSADLVLGYSSGSGVGMNMFVSEFGVSTWGSGGLYGSGTNIVETDADWTYKQVTAEKFLENSRVKFFDPGEPATNDRYKLWDRVNEDTYNSWSLGDFQHCQFGFAFDQWQLRPNAEHIVFDITHSGNSYASDADHFESLVVDSGVAYHTQIENDFLRFHLSDVPSNFYSVDRRITKNVPHGYKFSERAVVVESVISHKTGDGIVWSSCDDVSPSGPRLIVSLYTKKQEPYWIPEETNWGLVNRKVHYLMPSSCIMRLDTTFTYEDLCDTTESWAIFPDEPRIKEFGERYFSDDVNDMFVQYDLAYPSGAPFSSRVELHSAHVRMADTNIYSVGSNEDVNLIMSGAFPSESSLTLNVGGFPRGQNDSLPLKMNVPLPYDIFTSSPSGFTLNVNGAFVSNNVLPLFIPPQSGNQILSLMISGEMPSGLSDSMFLSVPKTFARHDSSDDTNPITSLSGSGSFFGMPLVMFNADVAMSPDGPILRLNTFGASGSTSIRDITPLTLWNSFKNIEEGSISGLVNLNLRGGNQQTRRRFTGTMPLYINTPNIIDRNVNLYIHNPEVESLSVDSMNLVTANYSSNFGSATALWKSDLGTGIGLEDDFNSFLSVDNEIRGVDLVAYGSCTGNSPSKAIDQALFTDDTVWRAETCNDGGIFRAKNTYTNSGAINFSGGFGYSGNYYGIRKFTNLMPSVAYDATLTIKTGGTDPIPVPRTFEEWGYGMCGPAWHVSGCCTEDCDQNLVFSGVKFVGDDAASVAPSANQTIDSEFIIESGRQENANYGAVVSVKGDLMAVAAPRMTIPEFDAYRVDASGNADPGPIDVSGAGSVFLYRRSEDVPGKRADWRLIEPLMLPVGFRKDYIQRTAENLLTFDQYSISGNKWQIGQEGREFGSSLDMAVSGDREVLVIGAPRAKWNREFADINTSGVPTAGIVFTDLFSYNKTEIASVASVAARSNILWKYFSAPWDAGTSNEWYAEINPKIIVLQLTYVEKDYPVIPEDESSWFVHRYIPRLDDLDLLEDVGSGVLGGSGTLTNWIAAARPIIFNQMVSGVKDAFFTAFPSGQPTLYSGIPAIVGMFKEQTGSTAGALQYADTSGNIVNIYDEFADFYHEYSSMSGVYDQLTNQAQSGHLNTIVGRSENWAQTARELLSSTFDSGRMASTFTNATLNRTFITSGVGQIWGDTHAGILQEFQVPPASGGRVYVFENERGNFNCVQVIVSPNDQAELLYDNADMFGATYGKVYNDRFGHSVAISKNSEIISIGTPWQYNSCRIFERKDSENQRVYDNVLAWCQRNGKTDASSYYGQVVLQSGASVAKTATYDFLTSSERFEFRNDVDFWDVLPSPYQLSYDYGYGDIEYIGTRQFLPQTFAGTSRLGWSTSVNDNGDIVAFGAPTDSFNEFEDSNIWGDNELSWASYLNAGAVRVFENRKYHPHSGVVEFGLFGNLDRSVHNEEREAGHYDDQWPLIFGSGANGDVSYSGKYWRRTEFSEIEIPTDAGLAFIMTPELDAASDEIIDNIKNWLALGDRNLVIVGNDPVWEENGLYSESNEIVNSILEKLGSRMRIFPARNESYALNRDVLQEELNDNKYNITRAKIPSYSAGATIGRGNYYGKGFGDIRIDLERDDMDDYLEYMNCPEGATCGGGSPPIVNVRCEFPLSHQGDLRAEWTRQCIKTTPTTCKVVTYKKNWPFNFGNHSVDCDNSPQPLFQKRNQDPVPVLTTAEHIPPSSWYKPETSGVFCDYRPVFEWRIRQEGSIDSEFAEHHIDEISFNIEEDVDSIPSGNFSRFTYSGDFVDPEPKNGRDGLLQAFGGSFYPEDEERVETRTLFDNSILALVESGKTDGGQMNNSRVYLMATQWSEDDASRGIDSSTSNDDKNTEFYINMVRKDCTTAPRGVQVNGFTGRTSLENAYYLKGETETTGHRLGSKLNVEFAPDGGSFLENQEISDINDLVDFVWLAHPSGKPSDDDLNSIKSWLNLGNKKLIITYNAANEDTRQEIAGNVDYLCSGLNITSRPFFIPSIGEYFVTGPIIRSWNGSSSLQKVNTLTDSVSGCNDGYDFARASYSSSTSLSGLHFSDESFSTSNDPIVSSSGEYNKRRFVPISGAVNDAEWITWFEDDVTEDFIVYPTNRWKIDANATIEFPAVSGSGYRMFVNWVSETSSEKFNICGVIDGATDNPNDNLGTLFSPDVENTVCGSDFDLSKTTIFTPSQSVYDLKALGNTIRINLNTNLWSGFIPSGEMIDGAVPATPRLLSISGCPLPISTETIITTTSGKFPIGVEEFDCRWIVNQAQSGVIPGVSRPVSHRSELYCDPNGVQEPCEGLGTTLIEDGPVIVAEEFENFSSFSAGLRRSKIIVISDSTMLQGQNPYYRADTLGGNQDFIRSLYPESLPVDYYYGRNWFFTQKLRAPERGSAAKYHAVSGSSVGNITSPLYGGGGVVGSLSNYTDQEDNYDPTSMSRPDEIKGGEKVRQRIEDFYNNDALGTHGIYPRFSGDFLNISPPMFYDELLGESGSEKNFITDAKIGGGMNDLMKINNTDYLDLDVYYSGCPGDLFGYSLDLSDNRLVVGSPFNAYHTEGAASGVSGIVQWHEIENDSTLSAIKIAEDGGAGAAFVFERTGSGSNSIEEFLPWEFVSKIKPSSLNVGIYDFDPSPQAALTAQRGPHNIVNSSFIIEFGRRSDNFGASVAIDSDMIVVGSPNHDYETLHSHVYSGALTPSGLNSAFLRKGFNAEFDIPEHFYHDLGSSGVRSEFSGSGTMVLNNGAVFNFRNELVDFQNRLQNWVIAEKLYAQGYNDRIQTEYTDDGLGGFFLSSSGTENDNFGRSVSINRAGRGDSDYTLVVGTPNHEWPTSGNHPSSGLVNAGSAYSFDAMLRGQVPSIPNSGGWIDAHIFGQKKDRDATDRLETRVYQNISGVSQSYQVSGIIFSNRNGDVFLEVSGFDPSTKGFIAHRPYVEKVEFLLHPPMSDSEAFNMITSGRQVDSSGDMNLVLTGPDQANVYNTMNLYQSAVLGSPSGTVSLFVEAPSGHSGVLNLNLSNTQTTDSLPLRVRGY